MDVATELSLDIILNDLDNLVDYLLNRFNQDKIIIMGHSWGTILGIRYSINHPEKVKDYIAIGQAIEFKKGEILAATTAVEGAKAANDNKYVNELSSKIYKFTKMKKGYNIYINVRNKEINIKVLKR